MAIKSLLAEFGDKGVNGKVFLGGAVALNLLGETTSSAAVPKAWKSMLDTFLSCKDDTSFTLGGYKIIKTGYYVKAEGMKFTETEHGAKGPAYWELGAHASKLDKVKLAAMMRKVLEAPGTKCGDPWIATLIAAMFLSEVARNPRSFIINLMLLDLLEGGVRYGRKGDKELDFGKLLKFDADGTGKSKTYAYESGSVTVGGKGNESGTVRGGKLPMSQLGAMEQYQKSVSTQFEYKNKYDQLAKQAKLDLKAPASADVAYHFPNALLEKECTVLLRWLVARFAKKAPQYKLGERRDKVEKINPWTKKAEIQEQIIDTYATVILTPLREHARKSDWTEATVNPPVKTAAAALVHAVKSELHQRQSGVANQLA